jgi:hypothetical protein
MLNFYMSGQSEWREELKLKYWQFVLRLARAATGARRWAHLFNENRNFMALAFLTGLLIGLISVLH